MRIGNHSDGTVAGCQMSKLVGCHHTTLYMHVAVDKAWHQIGPSLTVVRQIAPLHLLDVISLNHNFAIVYFAANHINDMS